MIIPDINLLLYAYNPHAVQHPGARRWWEEVLNGEELIGLPNEVLLGFVRIATHSRLGPAAIALGKARALTDIWLAQPNTRILAPAPDHFARTMDLLARTMSSGSLTSDAVLAVYAITHRAVLHTNDTDFARFPELAWKNPLVASTEG